MFNLFIVSLSQPPEPVLPTQVQDVSESLSGHQLVTFTNLSQSVTKTIQRKSIVIVNGKESGISLTPNLQRAQILISNTSIRMVDYPGALRPWLEWGSLCRGGLVLHR